MREYGARAKVAVIGVNLRGMRLGNAYPHPKL